MRDTPTTEVTTAYTHANSNCLHVKSLKNDRVGFVFDESFVVVLLFIAEVIFFTYAYTLRFPRTAKIDIIIEKN